MRLQLSLTLPRESVSVPLVRHLVGATLERAGVTPECVEEVKVAVSEACTNAYQHALAGDNYEVVITLDDDALAIDVVDKGTGFTHVPTEPTTAIADTNDQEHGRGIELIRALTDTARFDTVSTKGAAVRMRKRLDWKDDAPWVAGTPTAQAPSDDAGP